MNVPIIFDFEGKGVGKVESQLNKIEKSTDKTQSNISKAYDKVKAIGGNGLTSLQSGFNKASKSASELESSIQDVTSSLGGKGGLYGVIAAATLAAGASIYNLGNAYNSFNKQFSGFGNKQEASSIFASIGAVGEFDAKSMSSAVKVMAKEYKISKLEALKLIEGAANKGLNLDEGLGQITEYTSQLKKLGYSANDVLGVITKSEVEGWFSDKAIDTIKEGGLRLREMPKATSDALKAAGIDSDKLLKGIVNGTLSYEEAIKQVSVRMVELGEDSRITGTLIADVFGAPGEDVSFAFFEALAKGNTELAKMPTLLTEVDKSNKALAVEMDKTKTTIMGWFGSDATLAMNNYFTKAMQGVRNFAEAGTGTRAAMSGNALWKLATFGSPISAAANFIGDKFEERQAGTRKQLANIKSRVASRAAFDINPSPLLSNTQVSPFVPTIKALTNTLPILAKAVEFNSKKTKTNILENSPIISKAKAAETKANGTGGVGHQITINIDSMVKQMTITQNDDPKKIATVVEQLLNEAVVNAKQLK